MTLWPHTDLKQAKRFPHAFLHSLAYSLNALKTAMPVVVESIWLTHGERWKRVPEEVKELRVGVEVNIQRGS